MQKVKRVGAVTMLQGPARDRLESLVQDATGFLILVTPEVDLRAAAWEHIELAARRGVEVEVYVRDEPELLLDLLASETLQQLRDAGVRFSAIKTLGHGSVYLTEQAAVVCGNALVRHPVRGPAELDLGCEVPGCSRLHADITAIIHEQVCALSRPLDEPRAVPLEAAARTAFGRVGFCIRCAQAMAFNTWAPYCRRCYPEWARLAEPLLSEAHCHHCGNLYTSCRSAPVCRTCEELLCSEEKTKRQ